MARGTGGASGRLVLGAVLIAGAWIIGYWLTPSPGPKDVEVEFGPPPKTQPEQIAPPPVVSRPDPSVRADPVPQTTPQTETTALTEPAKPKDPGPEDLPRIVPPKFRQYFSVEGDTFATIAKKFFGDSEKWTIIARANPLMDPNKLRPGTVVMVPVDPDNIQGRENLAGFQIHTIKSGDSLSTIAKQYYGKASLWGVIASANPEVNPDRLKVGSKLKIPPAPTESTDKPAN